MPNRHTTLTSLFEDIADAIRAKTGSASTIIADDFDTAIDAIPTGGSTSDDYFWIEYTGTGSTNINIATNGNDATLIDVALKYSTDKETWTDITLLPNSTSTVPINSGQKIYLKNSKNTFSVSNNAFITIKIYDNFNVGGRITSLINNIDGKGLPPYSFYKLFINANKLKNANNLVLPQYTNVQCYGGMFSGCSELETAPALPATVLADYCYANMFVNCKITTAPALPATVLAASCYTYMFQGCSNLTTAPALPATVLANYCYSGMFDSCSSLTTAPALPAQTSTSSCYSNMFRYCTSLTTVPNLPIKSLQYGSYQQMFDGCSALKVYTTSDTGHDKAWTIPSDGTFTNTQAQNNMFRGVDTDSVPANFPAASGQSYTYYTQNTPVSAS